MNDQTQQLIEKLADKLGTTADHLWGVLVRQAPISSTTDAIALCLFAAALIWGYRIVRRNTGKGAAWEHDQLSTALSWVLWGFGAVALLCMVGSCLSTIVSGFVNPEYWALQQLLHK